MSKFQIIVLSLLSLIACVILAGIGIFSLIIITSSSGQAVAPQKATPTPILKAAATKTPKPTVQTGQLPGLHPNDMTVSLEQRDFNCTNAKKMSTVDLYNWTCESSTSLYDFHVEIYGQDLNQIDYISAVALDFGIGSKTSASFLGFVATAPYDDAQPTAARSWVESRINDPNDGKTQFGGVAYELYGTSDAKTLTLGDWNW